MWGSCKVKNMHLSDSWHVIVFIPPPFVDTSLGCHGWRERVVLVLEFTSGHCDTSQYRFWVRGQGRKNILRSAKSREARKNGIHLLKMVGSLFTGLSVKYVDNRWNE